MSSLVHAISIYTKPDTSYGMPVKYTVTLTSVGSSSVVVFPKAVIEGFGLKKGQKLEMIVRDDGVYIPLHQGRTKSTVDEPKIKGD